MSGRWRCAVVGERRRAHPASAVIHKPCHAMPPCTAVLQAHGTPHAGLARLHVGRSAMTLCRRHARSYAGRRVASSTRSLFFCLRPVSHILGREGGREINIEISLKTWHPCLPSPNSTNKKRSGIGVSDITTTPRHRLLLPSLIPGPV